MVLGVGVEPTWTRPQRIAVTGLAYPAKLVPMARIELATTRL